MSLSARGLIVAGVLFGGCGGSQRAPAPLAAQAPVPPPSFSFTVPDVHPPDAPAPGQLAVADTGGVAHSRPATLDFASHAWLERLRWRRWGLSPASASGTVTFNDCLPDCAHGGHHHLPAAITVSKIVRCGGRPWYSHAVVSSGSGHRLVQPGYIAPPCDGGPQ